ncbi:MAG: hypothetical protein KJN93_00690, partial [Alphaproteobacteria bacterium]|nr:hypothetical protein [Alphaproteobacteria bacterium]
EQEPPRRSAHCLFDRRSDLIRHDAPLMYDLGYLVIKTGDFAALLTPFVTRPRQRISPASLALCTCRV